MSLDAVQQVVKSALDGLETPNALFPPAVAYVAPPVSDDVSTPRIYIWGSTFDEGRQTAGRGTGGAKEVKYDLMIWIIGVEETDDPDADAAFPQLIEATLSKLRTIAMPQQITDAVTAEVSQLIEIGERMRTSYGAPQALNDQRYLWMNAAITCRAVEVIIA